MNTKKIHEFQEYQEQVKQSDDIANELMQNAVKDCVSLQALQSICQEFAIKFLNIAKNMNREYLNMGFEDGEADDLARRWLDSRMENINTMYADAAQRFATVH